MKMRQTRRGCGLAFGLMLWSAGSETLRADEPAAPLKVKEAPALIELESSKELGGERLAAERIQERHPNRALKAERVVAQDESGNYFNHGAYVAWDEEGRMSGKGEYRHGKREGKWTRWFTVQETEEKYGPLTALGFQAPFTSQADFSADKLDGAWTIVDAKQRPVAAWEFADGVRHGLSVWYHVDGKKYREVEYQHGDLDGMVRQWTPAGKLDKEEKFVAGFRLGVKVEYYDSGELKSECEMLFAKLDAAPVDDWWNGTAEITTNGRIGRDQRHGKYQAWDREGHLILAGTYVDDKPNGKFTWWFSNGNKAIEGSYVAGKQDGLWTWYHENGLREIVGEYAMGYEAGRWLMWADDGKVAEKLEIRGGPSEDPAIVGRARSTTDSPTGAPPVPQVAPAAAEEPTPTPEPEKVRRVTFEQLTIQQSEPEVNPDEPVVVEIEQATEELGPAAKAVLKPVAERPEGADDGS